MLPLPIDAAQARKQQRRRERRIWPDVLFLRRQGFGVYRAGAANKVVMPAGAPRLLDDGQLRQLAAAVRA